MAEQTYDLAIIGAGPAGYVGGIRAAQLGLTSCVIEKEAPGGVCLNIGCIPSKTLIHQAEVFGSIKEIEHLGVKVDISGLDYSKAFQASRKAASSLSKGVDFLLKKNKVPLVKGNARIVSANRVEVEGGTSIEAKRILIATGSRPIELPGFEFDEELILSSNGALMLEDLPKRLIILGGGAIGCEFAYIMSSFGVEVTIVEMLDQILPMEDADTAAVLAKDFKKRGIKLLTSTKASSVTKQKDSVVVELESKDGSKSKETADKLLVVVGRRPNTEEIGLDTVGISTERGFIPVGDYYRTSIESIYAVGDVTSSPLLAHVASKEAEIAVEHMAGHNPPPAIDPRSIPAAVYTEPQIASFGLTEKRAGEEGVTFEIATFPYRGAGKSVAVGKTEGLVKILFEPESREILGAHVAGADATEMIHELLLARTAELLPEDIATMIHAHPTLSEAVMEATRAAEGWAIHM